MEAADCRRNRHDRRADRQECPGEDEQKPEAALRRHARHAQNQQQRTGRAGHRAARHRLPVPGARKASAVETLVFRVGIRQYDFLLERGEDRFDELGRHLQEHEKDSDHHRNLDGGHVRRPDGVVDLLGDDRVGATVPAAQEHDDEVEQDEEGCHRVHDRLRARLPVRVEEVHAHVRAALQGPARPQQIVGAHGELRHFERPDRVDARAARENGEHQHGEYHQEEIHRGDAEPSHEGLDTAHVFDQCMHDHQYL